MTQVQRYIDHAVECDRLARKARSPDERKLIEGMAATWRVLADQRTAKMIRPS